MEKLKILVSAYACGPNRGSEPGMGWNFVMGLSEFHEVHVITEKRKWESPINEFLEKNSDLNGNLKFYFIDKKRNIRLRKIWPPSYYWFYKKWQKKAYTLATELDDKENFDLVHQLNMVGYREPGYLWQLRKPLVWGPIGGLENSPWQFLPSLGLKGMIFYTGRNLLNFWQRNFKIRPRKAAMNKKSVLIAATPSNALLIKNLWNRKVEVICEVGNENDSLNILTKRESKEPLKIIWSGLHISRKNLPLLLRALKTIDIPFELHILGNGEMTGAWKNLARKLKLDDRCTWYGWLEREHAIEVMQKGHVFCITSISDLTSTVTLEALSYGLPIVCLNHCGFAHVVTDDCGIKIPLSSPKEAAIKLMEAFEKLYNNETFRRSLSVGALERAKDFSWEKKIDSLNRIYTDLISKTH